MSIDVRGTHSKLLEIWSKVRYAQRRTYLSSSVASWDTELDERMAPRGGGGGKTIRACISTLSISVSIFDGGGQRSNGLDV